MYETPILMNFRSRPQIDDERAKTVERTLPSLSINNGGIKMSPMSNSKKKVVGDTYNSV
jgi:hypothetical protein